MSPELRPYIEEANASPLREKMVTALGKAFKDTGEIKPTDMTAAIAPSATGKRTAFPMVWGYTVEGINHPLVNARVETAKDKKTFSEDWQKHRCVIPASYYFEWEHIPKPDGKMKTGDKYAIQPTGADVTWLAGLYHIYQWRDLKYPVFAILTREPSPELRKIHDRIPLILPEEAIDDWINPNGKPEDVVKQAVTDVVMEKTK